MGNLNISPNISENLAKKILLEVKRQLREYIEEEKGINDTVRRATFDVVNFVKGRITSLIKGKSIQTKVELGNTTVKIDISADINKEEPEGFTIYFKKGYSPMVSCTVPIKNGKIDKYQLADTIQHELSHAFQQDMAGKRYNPNYPYNVARNHFFDENDAKRIVARVVYLSDRHEQDSIANGLYSHFIQSLKDGKLAKKDETDAFKHLSALEYCERYISNPDNEEKLLEALKDYDGTGFTTMNILRKALSSAQKELTRKVTRALLKCQEDAHLYCGVCIHGDPNWMFR